MKQLLKYIAPCVVLLSISCTKRIDVVLPTSLSRLVVDGKFTIDTTQHTVVLSRTMDYFDPNPTVPYISNAVLTITEVETNTVYPLQEDENMLGHYRTMPDVFGKQGFNYKLEIEQVDIDDDGVMESYDATDFLPYIADQIDSIKLVYDYSIMGTLLGMPPGKDKGWNTLLYMQDQPTHEYYVLVGSRNRLEFWRLNEKGFFDDALFGKEGSQVYLKGAPLAFLPDSTDYHAYKGDTIGLKVQSTSLEYFRYLNDVESANSGGNPMMGNPANIRGNVSNGAVGFFSAFSYRYKEDVAEL